MWNAEELNELYRCTLHDVLTTYTRNTDPNTNESLALAYTWSRTHTNSIHPSDHQKLKFSNIRFSSNKMNDTDFIELATRKGIMGWVRNQEYSIYRGISFSSATCSHKSSWVYYTSNMNVSLHSRHMWKTAHKSRTIYSTSFYRVRWNDCYNWEARLFSVLTFSFRNAEPFLGLDSSARRTIRNALVNFHLFTLRRCTIHSLAHWASSRLTMLLRASWTLSENETEFNRIRSYASRCTALAVYVNKKRPHRWLRCGGNCVHIRAIRVLAFVRSLGRARSPR